MRPAIWLNHAHASQRDVAGLIREGLPGRVRVVASHKDQREDIFGQADEGLREPRFAPDTAAADYVAWAGEIARSRSVGALLAMRHRRALVGARGQFANAGVRLAGGAVSAEALALCDHKDRFTAAMLERGIAMPRTIPVRDVGALSAAILEIEAGGAEACVKPAIGVYGRGFWRFTRSVSPFDIYANREIPFAHPDAFADAYGTAKDPALLLIMEYLPGPEYSVDCVCDEGRLAAAASRRKELACQVVETAGPQIDLAEAVVAMLRLDGLVNVQVKAGADGCLRLLEVNTRPSGGIGFSSAAGVNLPAACAAMLLGLPVRRPVLKDPVAIRRVDAPVRLDHTSDRLAWAGP